MLGLGFAGIVGALLAGGMAFALARGVARPVARIAAASRRLAAGDTPATLPTDGPTELATLATSFNELSEESLARTMRSVPSCSPSATS